MKLPALKDIRRSLLADLGIPDSVIEYIGARADASTPATPSARSAGSGIELPPLDVLRRQAVGLLGAQPRPRPVQGPLLRGRDQRQDGDHHRRLERHRPGRGPQDRRGRRHPDPRRPLAWTSSRRPRPRSSARAAPPTRTPATSRTTTRSTRCVEKIFSEHASIDMLVNNAGPLDPALGRGLLRPLPRLRAHDPAQLPRHDQADHRGAPAHAREEGRPHRQRVLDRRPDQPAALLGLRRLQGGARRLHPRRVERDDRRQRDVHHDPHAAGAHADDRADEDLRLASRRSRPTRPPT